MYLMYWVACTKTQDFHRRPIVFGEVLARPRVVWWGLWSSLLDLRSRNRLCSFPFAFWMLSRIRVWRGPIVRSLTMGTPRYLNESTTLRVVVFWGGPGAGTER